KDVTTPIVRIQSIFKNDELVSKVTLSQVMAGISSQQVKFRIQRFEERISYLKAVENLIDTEISTGELLPGFKLDWKKREEKMSKILSHVYDLIFMISGYDEIYNNLLEYDMDLPLTQITEGI